jgi:hypothetical protein
MALTTETISKAILGVAQARFPFSKTMPGVAQGVANAIMAWISNPINVQVQGSTAGVAGAGTVAGKMLFPSPGGPIVANGLRTSGVIGVTAAGVGQAIGTGVATALNSSAQYQGTSAGVGTGADVSKVARANKATLQPLLISNLQAARVNGVTVTRLSIGLALGIADLVLTGTGLGGVTGSASAVAATSTSISVIL